MHDTDLERERERLKTDDVIYSLLLHVFYLCHGALHVMSLRQKMVSYEAHDYTH